MAKFLMIVGIAFGMMAPPVRADLPKDEAGAMEYLAKKKVSITKDSAGHAVKLRSPGEPAMSAEEYQLIGQLTHLEEIGINGAPLKEDEWGFLKPLTKLKKFSVWHSGKFSTLEPFSGLPIESLTIGGCVGLRDLNRANPEKLRNAVVTLHELPRLKQLSLYHSPLAPDDAHVAYLAKQFPTLEDLRLDFGPTAGSKTTITPAGLKPLQQLPLKVLLIEEIQTFTPEHFNELAGIKPLQVLLVDTRKKAAPKMADCVESFKKLRPEVQVVVSKPGDVGPPRAKSKN